MKDFPFCVILDPQAALRLGIGYLPEDRLITAIQEQFPIPTNITLGNLQKIQFCGLLRKRKEQRLSMRLAYRMNIKAYSINQPISSLSTGNKQKVLLSRLLFCQCSLMMIDEPTKNLDHASRLDVFNFFNEFLLLGGAILYASSSLEELTGMCNRVLVREPSGRWRMLSKEELHFKAKGESW